MKRFIWEVCLVFVAAFVVTYSNVSAAIPPAPEPTPLPTPTATVVIGTTDEDVAPEPELGYRLFIPSLNTGS